MLRLDGGRDLLGRLRAASLTGCLLLLGCATVRVPPFGIREGQLAECPAKRACVSSQSRDPQHRIAPIPYHTERREARLDLIRVVRTFDNAKIVSNHRHYLRVEFPSTAVKSLDKSEYYFEPDAAVDDVEFYLPPGDRVIQVRAAARLGVMDSGENRQRIEHIRRLFEYLQQRH
ncbi:MAG: DUF1499 domain-containing protein [Gammaproteobacteria bacterium]